jgi:hypothetical protein
LADGTKTGCKIITNQTVKVQEFHGVNFSRNCFVVIKGEIREKGKTALLKNLISLCVLQLSTTILTLQSAMVIIYTSRLDVD